jgi:plastocyanin
MRKNLRSTGWESTKGVSMKHTLTIAAVLAAAGAALALTSVAGGRTNVTTLRATVGPGFTITLTKAGRRVVTLAPGMYRITVLDRSSIHNFKLEKSRGGTFERTVTSVPFKGTRTLTVRLTVGRWEFYCVPHERSMKGHFTVGSISSTQTTTDDHGNDG